MNDLPYRGLSEYGPTYMNIIIIKNIKCAQIDMLERRVKNKPKAITNSQADKKWTKRGPIILQHKRLLYYIICNNCFTEFIEDMYCSVD